MAVRDQLFRDLGKIFQAEEVDSQVGMSLKCWENRQNPMCFICESGRGS